MHCRQVRGGSCSEALPTLALLGSMLATAPSHWRGVALLALPQPGEQGAQSGGWEQLFWQR